MKINRVSTKFLPTFIILYRTNEANPKKTDYIIVYCEDDLGINTVWNLL